MKSVTPANFSSPGPPPKQQKEKLTIKVNITETNKFKELAELVGSMLKDERIERSIRQEYVNRFKEIKDNITY